MSFKVTINTVYLVCVIIVITTFTPPIQAKSKQNINTQKLIITTSKFKLLSLVRFGLPSDTLTIYLEGDGHAWKTRTQPSNDPTPSQSTAMRLAYLDPNSNVAYLARPCQFALDSCDNKYWTYLRYGNDIIDSLTEAFDTLKAYSRAHNIRLIGFSGGGYLALRLASIRHDISEIITISANIDPTLWTTFHGISPLKELPNTSYVLNKTSNISQTHYYSKHDKIIPCTLQDQYKLLLKQFNKNIGFKRVTGTTHTKGWIKVWPILLSNNNHRQ